MNPGLFKKDCFGHQIRLFPRNCGVALAELQQNSTPGWLHEKDMLIRRILGYSSVGELPVQIETCADAQKYYGNGKYYEMEQHSKSDAMAFLR